MRGGFFCLPGVKKVNGASRILDSGTWCHQELFHIVLTVN